MRVQDVSSPGAKLVLELFGQILDVVGKYPHTDGILLPMFERLTRRLLTGALEAPSPTGTSNHPSTVQ